MTLQRSGQMDKLSCHDCADSIMTSGFLWEAAGDNPKPVLSWDCVHLVPCIYWLLSCGLVSFYSPKTQSVLSTKQPGSKDTGGKGTDLKLSS